MKNILVVLATGIVLAACSDAVASPRAATTITALPRPLTASERTLVTATGGFAFNLLRAETARQPDSNVFLSPLSASAALGKSGPEPMVSRRARSSSGGGARTAFADTLAFRRK